MHRRLEPHEVHLNRALNGRYVYCLTRPIFNELSAVYRELGYTQRLDFSCSSCLLNLCSTLGNYYFPYKKKLENEYINEYVNEQINEPNCEPIKEQKPTKKTNATKSKKRQR